MINDMVSSGRVRDRGLSVCDDADRAPGSLYTREAAATLGENRGGGPAASLAAGGGATVRTAR